MDQDLIGNHFMALRMLLSDDQLANLINETFSTTRLRSVVWRNKAISAYVETPLAEGVLTVMLALADPSYIVVITDFKGERWQTRFIGKAMIPKLNQTNFSFRFGQMRV